MRGPGKRILAVGLLVIAVGVIAGMLVALVPTGLYGVDTTTYLAAGERLNAGHPLYRLSPGDRDVDLFPPLWTMPLVSSPTIAALWRPLAALPFEAGRLVWWLICCGSLFVAIAMLWRRQPVVTAIGLITFHNAVAHALAAANLNPIVLLGAVLAWWCYARGNHGGSGILAGVIAAFKLTPMTLVWWLLVTGPRRARIASIGAVVATLSFGIVLAGVQAHLDYVAMLGDPAAVGIYPDSLAGVAVRLGLQPELARLTPWVGAIVGLVAIGILRRRAAIGFIVAIVTMTYASPAITSTWAILLLAAIAPLAYPMAGSVPERTWSWLGPLSDSNGERTATVVQPPG